MAADGVGPAAALQELIDEDLLLQEAERLGLTEERATERSIERLMVRAMLHDLEKENTPESISEREAREYYAQHAKQLQVLERRGSWHILVKDTGDAGRTLAESILRELRQADDPRTVYQRYANTGPAGTGPEVKAEELPPITKNANIEKPYKNALFAAKAIGPLKKVVKTSYGWHAIVLTQIIPAERTTFASAEGEIRKRLSQAKRLQKVIKIVQGLQAKGLVHYDKQGVERLLAMPALPEPAH